MQNLIERISKIEEATERVFAQAEEEKKRIEREMQEKIRIYDTETEEETQKKLAEIRADYQKKSEAELKEQQGRAQQAISHIASYYEEAHGRLSDEIVERIVTAE